MSVVLLTKRFFDTTIPLFGWYYFGDGYLLLRFTLDAMVVASADCPPIAGVNMQTRFDENEIRAAEEVLVEALEAPDPTAWVYLYTQDAVFIAPGAPAIEGRDALLHLAKSMNPLSSVVITPIRTEGYGNLAYVYARGSWINGRPPSAGQPSNVRLVIVWRKEADGKWRIAQELMNADI